MNFESKFKGKLAENGLSMRKFAEQQGIVPQNLSQRIKRGSITYDEAVKFADVLGYDIEWLKRV